MGRDGKITKTYNRKKERKKIEYQKQDFHHQNILFQASTQIPVY